MRSTNLLTARVETHSPSIRYLKRRGAAANPGTTLDESWRHFSRKTLNSQSMFGLEKFRGRIEGSLRPMWFTACSVITNGQPKFLRSSEKSKVKLGTFMFWRNFLWPPRRGGTWLRTRGTGIGGATRTPSAGLNILQYLCVKTQMMRSITLSNHSRVLWIYWGVDNYKDGLKKYFYKFIIFNNSANIIISMDRFLYTLGWFSLPGHTLLFKSLQSCCGGGEDLFNRSL